jgi:hypothetical protein
MFMAIYLIISWHIIFKTLAEVTMKNVDVGTKDWINCSILHKWSIHNE